MALSSFLKLVENRRSIRRYLPRPVEREKILSCLEAARLAPSAENVQPWRFLVIDEPGIRDELCKGAFSGIYAMGKFAKNAPVLIVILARLDFVANRLGRAVQGTQYYLLDIGIAGEHAVLRAEELGLGTCWIAWFNTRKVRKILKIPQKYKPVAMLALGYPEKRPSRERPRKPLADLMWFNRLEADEEDDDVTRET